MEGPRAPFDNEFQDVVSFFNRHLREGQGWSIADEYPLAYVPGNLGNFRVIKDEGKVLSGAVVKNILIRNPVGIFKAAGIGSVVTDPSYRNQGLSRSILESSLESARQQRCDFAILWTNLYDYYRKLGFELAGSEVSLQIDKELASADPDLRFVESNKVAPEAIARLYGSHTCGSIRTAEDIRKYLLIPNMRVYTAWDQNNVVQAYAVEGKGADLNGYVHEWGGTVSKLLPLFAHIRKAQGRTITVIAPAHAQNLIKQLSAAGAARHDGVLGMIKILNAPNMLGKIKRYARHLGIDKLVLEVRDGMFYFGQDSQIFRTDSEADMVRLIFGPMPPSQIHDFDAETAKVLESVLPIPMWVWGWDSV